MEPKNYIYEELREVAPALLGMEKAMPNSVPEFYFENLPLEMLGKIPGVAFPGSVPSGYFQSFPGLMLNRIREAGPAVIESREADFYEPSLPPISNEPLGDLPAGYFDKLPELIMSRIKSQDIAQTGEDETGTVLQSISRQPVGELPYAYFDSLPQVILQKVLSLNSSAGHEMPELDSSLNAIPREPVGFVPESYFEELPSLILQKTKRYEAGMSEVAQELEEVAPFLNTISRQPVGYVPAGYFESLHSTVKRVEEETPVRVMGTVRSIASRFAPYAAAASIALALWFGYNSYVNNSSEAPDNVVANTNQLAETPQIEEQLHDIDVEAIAGFLDATSATPVETMFTPNPDNVEDMIKTMQSETLQDFIEKMPSYPEDKNG